MANEAVRIYKELAKLPELSSASLSSVNNGTLVIESKWQQRLISKNEEQSILRSHTVLADSLNAVTSSGPFLTDDGVWKVRSPSGKWILHVKKGPSKDKNQSPNCYFEIWSNAGFCEKIIDVSLAEKHGTVYDNDGAFGSVAWNQDEDKIAYIAEKKIPKASSFFTEASKKDELSGEKFVYKEDWGEALVNKYHPVVCILDISSSSVAVIENGLESLSAGQVVWCPDGRGVVFCAYFHAPFRLGITHCPIRRSILYYADLDTMTPEILSMIDDVSVRCPRFSPDGKYLVYLECQSGGPHAKCLKLELMDWQSRTRKTLVDIVTHASASDHFHGLFNPHLAVRCWSEDNTHIFLSTPARSRKDIFSIDISTGLVRRLTNLAGSWSVLDVYNNIIIAGYSSLNMGHCLVIGKVTGVNGTRNVNWIFLDQENLIPGISWRTMLHMPRIPDPLNPNLSYESVIMEPTEQESKALIVFPHGGPHSVFSIGYQIYFASLAKAGFTVALVNYRGSTGFGEDSINSLIGHIGDHDVADVQQAAEEVLQEYKLDSDKVVALGGSHGGFLVAHLIGQYPTFYKAAVMRNPVTNLVAKIDKSDIPDWGHVEVGVPSFVPGTIPTAEIYLKLYSMSPIAHIDKVVTPTMIMLGEDDRRVPPSLGIEYHKALLAKGIKSRLMIYPGNGHPIKTVEAESDSFVNLYLWFIDNLH